MTQREYLGSITLETGAVVGYSFRAISSTDLPDSPVVPGTYVNPTLTIDEFGRVTAASSGSSPPPGPPPPPPSPPPPPPPSPPATIAAPTNVVVTPGTRSAIISWSPVTNATKYNIYRSLSSNAETLLATWITSPYTDSSLADNTEYFYKVTAALESAQSTEANGTTNPAPAVNPIAQWGLGAPFYQDLGETQLAVVDGDPVSSAHDSVGSNPLITGIGTTPYLDLYAFSQPSVSFDGVVNALRAWGLSMDSQNFTMMFLINFIAPTNYLGQAPFLELFGEQAAVNLLTTIPLAIYNGAANGSSFPGSSAIQLTYGAHVVTIIGTASNFIVRIDGVSMGTFSAMSHTTSIPLYTIGGAGTGYSCRCAVAAGMAFNVALSGTQITDTEAFIRGYATVGTTFNPSKACFVFVGDSITQGFNINGNNTNRYPDQMFGLLTHGATYARSSTNLGIAGSTIENWQITANQNFVNGYYDVRRPKNVLFVWLGSNDGGSYPTSYTNLKALCTAYKNIGWTVIVLNKLPRRDEGSDADRQAFNAAIRADFPLTYVTRVLTGASYADVLLDVGADPTIGQKGDENNALYYIASDGVHLTVLGNGIIAAYGVSGLNFLGFT